VLSDKVTTSYAIDLKLVGDLTGATVAEIVALNPALLRLSTPRDIPYDLHLPPGTRDAYLERLKDIPEENRASWRFHVVKDGETLDQIATSLHGRAAEVAEYNEVTAAQPLEAGDELIVPVAGSSASNSGQQHYTPGRSDTLVTVADRFGITVEQLRSWNHLTSNRLTPGRSLYVAEPVRLAPGMRSSRARGRSTAHGAPSRSSAKGRRQPAPAAASRGAHAGSSRPVKASAAPAKGNSKSSKKRRY
jgi:membrane-bound lytic murein transglycosylase D